MISFKSWVGKAQTNQISSGFDVIIAFFFLFFWLKNNLTLTCKRSEVKSCPIDDFILKKKKNPRDMWLSSFLFHAPLKYFQKQK